SDRLWKAGASADPGVILDGTRLLDLKASLRRGQGRFEESLDLLTKAIAASRSEESAARLLLVKSATLEQTGDYQSAIESLTQARPIVEKQGDPRSRWVLEFNLCTCLCDTASFGDAAALLPTVRRLALDLGNGLDLLKVRWLGGRLSAGEG